MCTECTYEIDTLASVASYEEAMASNGRRSRPLDLGAMTIAHQWDGTTNSDHYKASLTIPGLVVQACDWLPDGRCETKLLALSRGIKLGKNDHVPAELLD